MVERGDVLYVDKDSSELNKAVTEIENVPCFKNGNEWSQIEVLDTHTPHELPASHTTAVDTAMASSTYTVENPKDPQLVNRQSNFYIDVYQRVKEALFHEGQGPTCSPIKNSNYPLDNVSKETVSHGTTTFSQATGLECSLSHQAEKSKQATNVCIQEIVTIHDIPVEPPGQDVRVVKDADQVQPRSCYQDKGTSQQHHIPLSSNPETSSDECEQDQCHKECQVFKNTIKANRERKLKD
ncbi:hypothetical protein Tco_0028932 [Tanacetum coccineum]